MRLGILGGSFDPIHYGHLLCAEVCLEQLPLDVVWFVPAATAPHKNDLVQARPQQRSEMVDLAIAGHPALTNCSLEIDRGGLSYTVDTLGALTRRYRKNDFVWLMGSDNLAQFHRWKDWRGIARTMPIAVIARPGYDASAIASPAMAWLRRFSVPLSSFVGRGEWSAPTLVTLRFDPDERSATAIRRADPDWALRFTGPPPRDQLTHRLILSGEETTAP